MSDLALKTHVAVLFVLLSTWAAIGTLSPPSIGGKQALAPNEWYVVPSSLSVMSAQELCNEEHGGSVGAVICPVIDGEAAYCRARCDRMPRLLRGDADG